MRRGKRTQCLCSLRAAEPCSQATRARGSARRHARVCARARSGTRLIAQVCHIHIAHQHRTYRLGLAYPGQPNLCCPTTAGPRPAVTVPSHCGTGPGISGYLWSDRRASARVARLPRRFSRSRPAISDLACLGLGTLVRLSRSPYQ